MKNYLFCFSALICASIVILSSCSNDNSGDTKDFVTKQRLVSEIKCYSDNFETRVFFDYNDNNQVSRVKFEEYYRGEVDGAWIQSYYYSPDHIKVEYEDWDMYLTLNDKGYVSCLIDGNFEDYYEYDSNDRLLNVKSYYYNEYSGMTRYSWFDDNVISILEGGDELYEMEYNQYDHNRINIDLNNFIAIYLLDSEYSGFWDIWPLKVTGKTSKNYVVSQSVDWGTGQQTSTLDWKFVGGYPTMCNININSKYDDDDDGVVDTYRDVYIMEIKYRN